LTARVGDVGKKETKKLGRTEREYASIKKTKTYEE